MDLKNVQKFITEYSALMQVYYEQDGAQITFDKGYWWTESDKKLQELETTFLSMGSDWESIYALWQQTKSVKERTSVLYLMGWSSHYKHSVPIFIENLKNSSTDISNIAARSLFPIIIGKKEQIDINIIIYLLHRRSVYHKNKALGFLWHWPYLEELRNLPKSEFLYIEKLAQHTEPKYAPIAKYVLERVS